MSTIQYINAYLENIPVKLQIQVLRYLENIAPKKANPLPSTPRRFRFIGLGNAGVSLTQIENLRDFAYND